MEETSTERSAINRWTVTGTLLVGLGAVGAVVPVMPSAPFLVLAASCYARGSPRAYRWLTGNRLFGSQLKSYQEGRGLSRWAKTGTVLFMAGGLTFSAALMHFDPLMIVLLAGVGIAISAHILTLKTSRD
ncbi:MAG: YbaN family protein [Methanomassiliicoccus sp.]|nr:YbaN family protein [Methanomassiliicoccus sp.]